MGTQIFIRTIVLRCNTRGHCQVSDPILLFSLGWGGVLVKTNIFHQELDDTTSSVSKSCFSCEAKAELH